MADTDVQRIYDKLESLNGKVGETNLSLADTQFHVKAIRNDLVGFDTRMLKVESTIKALTDWKNEEQTTRKLLTKVLGLPLYVVALIEAFNFIKNYL